MGALGLIVNAIVVWNTRYMSLALDSIRNKDVNINDADIQRLSPLGYDHINIVGRYSFKLPEELKNGELRPLIEIDEE